MDIRAYNREAWNRYVEGGKAHGRNPSAPRSLPEPAKDDFSILLTEQKPVPREWFPPLSGLDTLCLACGGGQQGPVLAAAGANVTVFDNAPRQLDQDRFVAEREGLANLKTVEGDMRDLSYFGGRVV
jgi:2-polyprenyl-3-methyl-5-hydroxy-6-metoxy-1,4-benzoquinol methylase